ncbi:hypothetical protein K4H30_00205 [Clostridium chauvoei]|uniref:hypothetical protein n=1 Tax=Clostridium chauvoei TaxID=46867 RepID=UPI001C85554B|nr:hypothetical protein [Clostridium chauvoei]MBX7322193.1 hypothetical protein [Clostridium chauvoei]
MKKLINSSLLSFILITLLFLSVACSKNSSIISEKKSRIQTETILKDFSKDGLLIKEINLDTLTDSSLKDLLENKSTNRGIYGFQIAEEYKQYLYFNGKSNAFIDLDFKIEDSKLLISANTEENTANNNEKLILIEATDASKIKPIQIKVNELEKDTATIYDF